MDPKPKDYLKTLDGALKILEFVGRAETPVSISEISREMNIGKSRVHRLLNTLKYWDFIEQDQHDRKYFLGPKILEIAKNKILSMDVIKVASRELEILLEECQETVHLATLNKNQVFYLDKKQGPKAIGIISKIGQSLPAYCTGLGKVLLAFLDDKELEDIIKDIDLRSYTSNTITDKKILLKELSNVREQGIAIDNQEIEEGLCCVAAPLKDYSNKVVAAISVSIPSFRFSKDKKKQIISSITKHAENISINLGYSIKQGGSKK